jgi:hypothetical protein
MSDSTQSAAAPTWASAQDGLRWLLDVVFVDFDRLDRRNQLHFGRLLEQFAQYSKYTSRSRSHEDLKVQFKRMQQLVRPVFEKLATGSTVQADLEAVALSARLAAGPSVHRVDPLTFSWTLKAPTPTRVLLAAVEIFANMPPGLLRRCRYQASSDDQECGRIFIGRKRQAFCIGHVHVARHERLLKALERYRAKRALREP